MSGSIICPLCGTRCGRDQPACGACSLSLADAFQTNAGGAKCARCGSAMPSGFDFCPVCGQDQRERMLRPITQSLRVNPNSSSPSLASPPAVAGLGAGAPSTSSQSGVGPFHPAMHPPPGSDRTVPTLYYGDVPDALADRTVPAPSVAAAPPGMAARPGPPPLAAAAMPAGAPRGVADASMDDSNTVPFTPSHPRSADTDERPDMTVPAMLASQPPQNKPQIPATKPDRPGTFSGGPTGEAAPHGVNVAHSRAQEAAPQVAPIPGGGQPQAPARLVLVARDGTEGESFAFPGAAISVGRTYGDILFPEDPFLSPVHVRITRAASGATLTDTGSTNGVFLRIGKVAPVYPGDMFMIGHQLLRLDQLDAQAQEHPPGVDGTRVFGTPLQPAWGRISQLGRGGVAGDHMYLRGSRVSFGREGGDHVFPNDPFVSREHARLRLEIAGQAMAVFLEDLGSANGTYVRIRGEAQISPGDTFRVGDQILKLRVD